MTSTWPAFYLGRSQWKSTRSHPAWSTRRSVWPAMSIPPPCSSRRRPARSRRSPTPGAQPTATTSASRCTAALACSRPATSVPGPLNLGALPVMAAILPCRSFSTATRMRTGLNSMPSWPRCSRERRRSRVVKMACARCSGRTREQSPPGEGIRWVQSRNATMSAADLDRRLALASAVAREAGAIALAAFRDRSHLPAHTLKGHQDYFTQTDAEIERLVCSRVAASFPADSFFGEETGGSFGPAVWVVDPIDGTANFARGIPHFCISIAFVRDDRVELGVIYQPVMDELYAARRGSGATRNGQAITVSTVPTVTQAIVEAGWSTRRPREAYVALIDRLLGAGAQVRRTGSGALGLAYVADGRIDAYCELHINAWDALAGLLIVEEAGGWTNDFLRGDGLGHGNPVLACTPALKDVLCDAMDVSGSR